MSVAQAGCTKECVGPGVVFGGEGRVGWVAVVEAEVVARSVVEGRQDVTDGQANVRLSPAQRHGNLRDRLAHAEAVEPGAVAFPAGT
jgi:hypothetical protein